MRCYICNYCDEVEGVDLLDSTMRRRVKTQYDGKPVCTTCMEVVKDTNDHYAWNDFGVGKSSSIEKQLDELEARLPDLFEGEVCPLDFTQGMGCSCTFKTGCMALKVKDNKNS